MIRTQIIERAAEYPNAPALIADGRVLTYGQLDSQSNRLAHRLRALGIAADILAAIHVPRSFDLAIASLAIWKAGGAFVPLDPSYPAERLSFMLNDAGAKVVVTPELISASRTDSPDPLFEPSGELAYVIYTSGSTGTPKGVEITHAGLENLIAWHRDAFSIRPADRASHVAGLGFDASVWELWPYLASGASVCLADEATRTSPELLRDWIVAQRITVSFVPTPIAERILQLEWPRETALRFLLTGGDALHHRPPADLPFAVVNNYGPTECTVVATSGIVEPEGDEIPSIGRPIANTKICLLDENLREASVGEIHIAGPSLARGYRNSPELTARKFIVNRAGDRLYRTGDLARRLPDGQLAFLGRVDDQIKIRGYRIEPQEIVRALNRNAGIRDSVVVARAEPRGERHLVAYLAVSDDFQCGCSQLRTALREHLPEYMIPPVFVTVDAFPMTPNGKVDYSNLPEPDPGNTLHDEAAAVPRTPTEERIAQIVSGLLQLDDVSMDDNFFMLGGHSLLGAQLIARLRKDFGVQIGLRSLFAAPTIAELSREVERLTGSAAMPAESHAEVAT